MPYWTTPPYTTNSHRSDSQVMKVVKGRWSWPTKTPQGREAGRWQHRSAPSRIRKPTPSATYLLTTSPRNVPEDVDQTFSQMAQHLRMAHKVPTPTPSHPTHGVARTVPHTDCNHTPNPPARELSMPMVPNGRMDTKCHPDMGNTYDNGLNPLVAKVTM